MAPGFRPRFFGPGAVDESADDVACRGIAVGVISLEGPVTTERVPEAGGAGRMRTFCAIEVALGGREGAEEAAEEV